MSLAPAQDVTYVEQRLALVLGKARPVLALQDGDGPRAMSEFALFMEDWRGEVRRFALMPAEVLQLTTVAYDRVLGPYENLLISRHFQKEWFPRAAKRASLLAHGLYRDARDAMGNDPFRLTELDHLRDRHLAEVAETRSRVQLDLAATNNEQTTRVLRRLAGQHRLFKRLTGRERLDDGGSDRRGPISKQKDLEPVADGDRQVYVLLWNSAWALKQYRVKIGSVSIGRPIETRLREHLKARRALFKDPADCKVELLGWTIGDEFAFHRLFADMRIGPREEFYAKGPLHELVNGLLRRDPELERAGWVFPEEEHDA